MVKAVRDFTCLIIRWGLLTDGNPVYGLKLGVLIWYVLYTRSVGKSGSIWMRRSFIDFGDCINIVFLTYLGFGLISSTTNGLVLITFFFPYFWDSGSTMNSSACFSLFLILSIWDWCCSEIRQLGWSSFNRYSIFSVWWSTKSSWTVGSSL